MNFKILSSKSAFVLDYDVLFLTKMFCHIKISHFYSGYTQYGLMKPELSIHRVYYYCIVRL